MSTKQDPMNQPVIQGGRHDGEGGGTPTPKPAGRRDDVDTRGPGGGGQTQKPVRSDDEPPGPGGGGQTQKPVRSDDASSSDR